MSASTTLVTTESARPDPIDSARDRQAFQLGERIAQIAAGLHAATYELLVLLREFDACAGWNKRRPALAGIRSFRSGRRGRTARDHAMGGNPALRPGLGARRPASGDELRLNDAIRFIENCV